MDLCKEIYLIYFYDKHMMDASRFCRFRFFFFFFLYFFFFFLFHFFFLILYAFFFFFSFFFVFFFFFSIYLIGIYEKICYRICCKKFVHGV